MTFNRPPLTAEEAERRKQFLERANADYARLREDPEAWQEFLEERTLWEGTLMDGLHDDPYPLDDERKQPHP